MSDRDDIHWLDPTGGGRRPPVPEADDPQIRELLAAIREEVRAPARLRSDIMRRVHAIPMPLWRRVLDWLLRPRTIRLSPAVGGLAAAGVAALAIFGSGVMAPGDAPRAADAEDHVTRFVFIAPGASSVQVTGDFVEWSPGGIALEDERGTGVWTVDVPLDPGVYQYAFIVNGEEWRPDPRAVSTVDDGFGRENSVVIVSDASET